MPATRMANYFTTHPDRATWGPRTIADHEFIYTVEGESRYTGGDADLHLSAHRLLLIPPGEPHAYYIPEGTRALISCIHFDGSQLPGIIGGRRMFDAGEDRNILSLFRRCADEFSMRRLGFQRLLDMHVEEIVLRLVRLHHRRSVPAEPLAITRAKAYLLDNYNRKVGRKEVADFVGVTPEHLNYMFRRSMGRTPTDYIEAVRIDKACGMLTGTTLPVGQIAGEVGYDDPLYFSRVFKKRMGVSPRRFRQRV